MSKNRGQCSLSHTHPLGLFLLKTGKLALKAAQSKNLGVTFDFSFSPSYSKFLCKSCQLFLQRASAIALIHLHFVSPKHCCPLNLVWSLCQPMSDHVIQNKISTCVTSLGSSPLPHHLFTIMSQPQGPPCWSSNARNIFLPQGLCTFSLLSLK